ncbi:hypothetical protein KEM48_005301 [Puccinia striiformis f. sp. tritici PST-130]|nr:hypothetical protein KEM48_005301 [Puccinia striiformis f. sp. tritici PST-130]
MSTHINTSLSSTPSSHLIIPGLIKPIPPLLSILNLWKGLPKCSICLIPLTINDTRTPYVDM